MGVAHEGLWTGLMSVEMLMARFYFEDLQFEFEREQIPGVLPPLHAGEGKVGFAQRIKRPASDHRASPHPSRCA
jgi:hypothetical protein